jgi:hypothetical protein
MDFNTRAVVKASVRATARLQQRIIRDLPREMREKTRVEKGSQGWSITKFHSLPILAANILKFGCGRVTHGSAGEKNHKRFAKDAGKGTQRRVESYASQVSMNNYEFDVIDYAYQRMMRRCVPTDLIRGYEKKEIVSKYIEREVAGKELKVERGKFTLTITVDKRHRMQWRQEWSDKRKNGLKEHRPHKLLTYAIGYNAHNYRIKFGVDMNSDTEVRVQCYTEAKVDGTIYRCSPYYFGRSWYDWGLFEFPETVESEGGVTCAAQIIGIFQYTSEDALTYGKIEMEGREYNECFGVTDDNIYVALRCQSKYLRYSDLEMKMIRKITMEEDVALYILPLKQLRGPLLVVPDVVGQGKVSSKNYIVIAAKSMWGNYFRGYMTGNNIKEEEWMEGAEEGAEHDDDSEKDKADERAERGGEDKDMATGDGVEDADDDEKSWEIDCDKDEW